jgi:hypothetical protein
MKILDFFLFLWVIFALLDPDPDPEPQINADPCGSGSGYGSGSETLDRNVKMLNKNILFSPHQSGPEACAAPQILSVSHFPA